MPTDYTLMDATAEILIMLLAAFLLGWLFCWTLKKLFGRKPQAASRAIIDPVEPTFDARGTAGSASSTRKRLYDDLDSTADIPVVDQPEVDLTEVDLPKASINTPDIDIDAEIPKSPRPRIDLPDLNAPNLNIKDKIDSGLDSSKTALGGGIAAATAGISAVAVGASSFKDKAIDKVEDMLPSGSVEGTNIEAPEIDTPNFTINEPTLETDLELPEIDTDSLHNEIDLPEVPDVEIDSTLTVPDLPVAPSSSEFSTKASSDSSQDSDDLSRISGIDSTVTALLNDKGIFTYQDLQQTNRTQLKEYLDSTGDSKLREIEPASWPHQATLCANRNWTKLSEYQSFLTGSNLDTRQSTPSYEVSEGDDLKKIEGIGPFFESLLNDAGITSYEQLKNSERDTLKEIIDAAGPDYRMHEPETWPYQAGLAYRGEWKKLQDYIQFMTGRSG